MKPRLLLLSLISAIALISFALGAYFSLKLIQAQPLSLEHDKSIIYSVKKGDSLSQIARDLHQSGLLKQPRLWVLWAWLHGNSRHLQAGDYAITQELSAAELLNNLITGKVAQHAFTIIPGWRFSELLQALQQTEYLKHTLATLNQQQVLKRLALNTHSPEGQFFADTYHFTSHTSDLEILQRAHQLLNRHLDQAWYKRQQDLPLQNKQQALIMASLIEKEGKLTKERPLIASVFYNRLAKNMRLQTDPTVIFALGDAYQGKLTKKDLRVNSPYNTYRHKGLPPGPIATISQSALKAALHPDFSDYLYFVAKGDGSHVFSKTLKEHNQAVRRYILKANKPKAVFAFKPQDLLIHKRQEKA